jgi:hypothetical protein
MTTRKELVKKILIFLGLLLLCNPSLLAQTSQHWIVNSKERSAIHVPQEAPEGLEKIYSNLGSSKTDLYGPSYWNVFGPASGAGNGYTSFVGMPFAPRSNSHVSQVEVAVQYVVGANQVNLSIYEDSGGVPGTLLAGPVTVTNLPDSGLCCTLASADFTPQAVTAGTRYWVVADTPLTGTGSDFEGTWATIVKPVIPIAYNFKDEGWKGTNADTLIAGAVLGTIP